MANYKHGVYVSETPTSLIPTVNVDSAIPFVVGIAPVNQVTDPPVNKPVLVQSYSEAVQTFGFQAAQDNGKGFKKFTYSLCEFMYSNFNFYGIVPCIFVNVLDPAVHRTAMTATAATVTDGTATIKELGIIPSTLVITRTENEETRTYVLNEDYELAFDSDGYLVINALPVSEGSASYRISGAVTLSGYKLDPSAITTADIIGGIDVATGARKGLETVADCFPRFGLVPGLLLAPGYSHDPEVAAVMAAKSSYINGHFQAMALIDAPASATVCKKYSDVYAWKNGNSVTSEHQVVCWPRVLNASTVYHASTHLAGVIGVTDNNYGNVPYCSPSNKSASITGLCLDDGAEVVIGQEEANYLNGQGIQTCNNFNNGWKIWGNRTATYPGVTDPKDAFIPVKRMFYWIGNTIIQTVWQKVDEPGNKRLIDTVVDSLNVWMNSLTARQQILGGRVEFREEDNPTTDLMDGKYHFKVYVTPPSPAEDMEFDLEIDTDYYSTLFS